MRSSACQFVRITEFLIYQNGSQYAGNQICCCQKRQQSMSTMSIIEAFVRHPPFICKKCYSNSLSLFIPDYALCKVGKQK